MRRWALASAKPPLERHVVHDVTVEQPVPRTFRRPRHRHGAAGRQQLRDDATAVRVIEWRIAQAVAQAVDFEVEAVQVQRVGLRAEVDHAPADALPELVGESLGCRPRQAIDHEREPRLEPDEHFGGHISRDDFTELAGA